MADRAQVRNASSPAQVKAAARRERERRERFDSELRAVMGTSTGRSVLWELLDRSGIYRSIFHPSSQIYYLAGRQDFGHELMALLLETDERLYQQMESEARERMRRDHATTDAAHTPSATEGEQD